MGKRHTILTYRQKKKYDHVFVKVAIKEILAEIDIKQRITVIIQKDNCTFQYKSCAHF